MYIYQEYLPQPQLRPHVLLIWVMECDSPEDFGNPMRIAPDGIVEAVFHYGNPLHLRFSGEPFEIQPAGSLVCQTRRFVEIAPNGSSGFISIRFRPGGAYNFFRPPVSEISDSVVAAEEIWGPDAHGLQQRLLQASDSSQRIRLVENFLIGMLRQYRKVDVTPLVRAVWQRKGQITVPELVDEFGLSERQLERIFGTAFGLPPKGFTRISRFLNSCSLLCANNKSKLTDVGIESGYYDQSHFIADFKAYSGMTPGQFAKSPDMSFPTMD